MRMTSASVRPSASTSARRAAVKSRSSGSVVAMVRIVSSAGLLAELSRDDTHDDAQQSRPLANGPSGRSAGRRGEPAYFHMNRSSPPKLSVSMMTLNGPSGASKVRVDVYVEPGRIVCEYSMALSGK